MTMKNLSEENVTYTFVGSGKTCINPDCTAYGSVNITNLKHFDAMCNLCGKLKGNPFYVKVISSKKKLSGKDVIRSARTKRYLKFSEITKEEFQGVFQSEYKLRKLSEVIGNLHIAKIHCPELSKEIDELANKLREKRAVGAFKEKIYRITDSVLNGWLNRYPY